MNMVVDTVESFKLEME